MVIFHRKGSNVQRLVLAGSSGSPQWNSSMGQRVKGSKFRFTKNSWTTPEIDRFGGVIGTQFLIVCMPRWYSEWQEWQKPSPPIMTLNRTTPKMPLKKKHKKVWSIDFHSVTFFVYSSCALRSGAQIWSWQWDTTPRSILTHKSWPHRQRSWLRCRDAVGWYGMWNSLW